ncbi:thiamine pyrophosphokinase [Phyllosticta paracitricarpa]|uniref:Thiamine pyrophosphokinase n=1 Tax=Phyllosticta paracitricarpa TaxID=2016321 RepID=A0ABR1N8I9_9PEZI
MNPFRPARFLARPPSSAATHRPQHPLPPPHQQTKPALLILNQPVSSIHVLERLWAHTAYRICADGGANRLFDTFTDHDTRRDQFLPSEIHGDLDSLRPSVRAYYAAHGVPISRDRDQYSTDFGKAIKQIMAAVPAALLPYPSPSPSPARSSTPGRIASAASPMQSSDSSPPSSFTDPSTPSPQPTREILILCTLGGRVDQGLGLLYEMLRTQLAYPDTRLWLFSESSVSFILPAGRNELHLPVKPSPSSSDPTQEARPDEPEEGQEPYFTENVGILPAFGPAVISTKGLEWDVTDWPTSVDGNVSTSNHVKSRTVEVTTTAAVLFTIERAEKLP